MPTVIELKVRFRLYGIPVSSRKEFLFQRVINEHIEEYGKKNALSYY